LASVDERATCDDAVAKKLFFFKPKSRAAVHRKLIELDERSVVYERVNPLTRRSLAARVLFFVRIAAGGR